MLFASAHMAVHIDYSHVPLAKKLGLLTPSKVAREIALVAAPEGFRELLGELPELVVVRQKLSAKTWLAICFVRSAQDLEAVADLLSARLPEGASAWIAHPKAHRKPGFNQNDVREAGLARGLVDYKVCSVDGDWSGLKFARRNPAL
jgi:hypothetical protein